MSQVTSCEQTLLNGFSCLEEWKVEPRHGEQPVFPLQSLAVVWGWWWKELLSPFLLQLAPLGSKCTFKDALRIPSDTRFEWLSLLTHQSRHPRGMQPLHPSLQQVDFPSISNAGWGCVHVHTRQGCLRSLKHTTEISLPTLPLQEQDCGGFH